MFDNVPTMFNKFKKFMSEDPKDPTTMESEVEMTENHDDQTSKKSKGKSKEFVELQAALDQANEALDEAKDKYLRLFAEFDNYKKRSIKENFDMRRTAAQETIISLLPVLDDFDRAKKNADAGHEVFSDGVNMIYQKLYNTLDQKGLKPMESAGVDFDPEYHEAITDIPAPTEDLKGKVIDTVEKGYILNEKIIRHAKVVVGK
jgi:molecular chaperone GrpE